MLGASVYPRRSKYSTSYGGNGVTGVSGVTGTSNYIGYLARPRLGTMRTYGSYKPSRTAGFSSVNDATSKYKKSKAKKSNLLHTKMDGKKRMPDYTDLAYREAVTRLRVLLAESYTTSSKSGSHRHDDSGEDEDRWSVVSGPYNRPKHKHWLCTPTVLTAPPIKRYPYYGNSGTLSNLKPTSTSQLNVAPNDYKDGTILKSEGKEPPTELMQFIERQEDYIEQLERESQFCRDELAGLLGKVKEVISENESLHEKQKSGLIKSVFDHLETETEDDQDSDSKLRLKSPSKSKTCTKPHVLEGPSIVFESRISELEAQLTQTKIDLRKAQEENDSLRQKAIEGTYDTVSVDGFKKQIEILQRDKDALQDTVARLQTSASLNKDNDAAAHEAKSAVEQARWERSRAEAETRRLQNELQRVRDNAAEQARRYADEKDALDRRYSVQVEQLSNDLAVQWDTAGKLQLELEKQKREIADLKRELAQKNAHIEELRKELQSKQVTLQSEQSHSNAEKSSLEQELINARLAADRTERVAKQEQARLQTEISSLRQRLDRADADALHSRRENLRLAEQLSAVEKELNLLKMINEDKQRSQSATDNIPALLPPNSPRQPDSAREKELSSMIMDMEAKHVATVAELESMIKSQNALMEKLTGECQSLTERLEDASARHKKEMAELQNNVKYLNSKISDDSQVAQPKEHTIIQAPSHKSHPVPVSELPIQPQEQKPSDTVVDSPRKFKILENISNENEKPLVKSVSKEKQDYEQKEKKPDIQKATNSENYHRPEHSPEDMNASHQPIIPQHEQYRKPDSQPYLVEPMETETIIDKSKEGVLKREIDEVAKEEYLVEDDQYSSRKQNTEEQKYNPIEKYQREYQSEEQDYQRDQSSYQEDQKYPQEYQPGQEEYQPVQEGYQMSEQEGYQQGQEEYQPVQEGYQMSEQEGYQQEQEGYQPDQQYYQQYPSDQQYDAQYYSQEQGEYPADQQTTGYDPGYEQTNKQ